jgi:hypothetical protein
MTAAEHSHKQANAEKGAKMAAADIAALFARLRSILQQYAGQFRVADDSASCYCLEANPGPASLRAWKGNVKRSTIPVAWIQLGKTYVSFHLMALYSCKQLLDGMSKELRARMQGKTCFNFTTVNEWLFRELETLTAEGLSAFRQAGFIVE